MRQAALAPLLLPLLLAAAALAPSRAAAEEEMPSPGAAWHRQAHARADSGDLSGALAAMGKAVEACSTDPGYPGCRADLLLRLGMPEAAAADLTRAVELGDDGASVLGRRAVALMSLGRFAEALPDLRLVLREKPDYEYAYLWILECLRNAEPEKAGAWVEEMARYAAARPTRAWSRVLLEYTRGGQGWSEERVLAEARNADDEGEVAGRLCEAWYYLAQERLWRKDLPGAADLFRKVADSGADSFYEVGMARGALKRMRPAGAPPGLSDLS